MTPGFKGIIDAEAKKRHAPSAQPPADTQKLSLTATTEDGTRMPFETWCVRWVAEHIDGARVIK